MSEEEIECRRAKILELKPQGLDQRDIAQVSHLISNHYYFYNIYVKKPEKLSGNTRLSSYRFSLGYSW
jgi:hypothetical protein